MSEKTAGSKKVLEHADASILDGGQARRAAGAIPRSGLGRRGAAALRRRVDRSPLPAESVAAGRGARPRAGGATWSRRSMRRRSTAPTSTVSRCAPPTPPARATARRGGCGSTPKSIACGACAGDRGRAGHRDRDRHRRRHPARRRRGGDDRADRADRGRTRAGDRRAPRRRARASSSSYAGSDIARGETLLRRGTRIGSREIGMLAACGLAGGRSGARGRSVGRALDRRRAGGARRPLEPAGVYDSNGADPRRRGGRSRRRAGAVRRVSRRGGRARTRRCARRFAACDMVVLSGGTSKGAGDLSHRIVSRLGAPGILVHGVALKPGKPLCLAVIDDKPVVVLPGFPTSAIFTFHAFVAPVIRAPRRPAARGRATRSRRACRCASPRNSAARNSCWSSLVDGRGRPGRVSDRQGVGLGDGFLPGRRISVEIDALAPALDAGSSGEVTLIGAAARAPDLVIMGSHDVALDVVVGALAARGFARAHASRSAASAGVAAASRGECDIAPVHLVDPATGIYNTHLARPGLALVPGWRRMQGFVFRPGDARFEGRSAAEALQGGARRPGLPDGQPQCRRRHPRADRQAARRRAARRAMPTSRARTTPSPPRWRRTAPTGASRSSRWRSLRPRLPADRARGLRFPAGREPPRPAGRAGVPRIAPR